MTITETLEEPSVTSKKCGTKYNASNVKPYEKEVETTLYVGETGVAMTVMNTVGCGIDTASEDGAVESGGPKTTGIECYELRCTDN